MMNDLEDALDVNDRYQNWVYRNPLKGAITAGVIATQIGTIWGYYAKGIGLPSLPFPLYNGVLFRAVADGAGFQDSGNFFVGHLVHFMNGVVFAIMFALVAYKSLPTFLPQLKSVQKGLVFGVVQTIVSIGFLFPYVYAPKAGFGLFSFGTADGWKLPFAVLLWHLIYGALLGLFFDPKKPDSAK